MCEQRDQRIDAQTKRGTAAQRPPCTLLGRIVTERTAVLPSHGGHNSHSPPTPRQKSKGQRLDDRCRADADRCRRSPPPASEREPTGSSAVQCMRSGVARIGPDQRCQLIHPPLSLQHRSTAHPLRLASLLAAMSRAGAGSLRERMQQGAATKKMQADKFVGLVEKKSENKGDQKGMPCRSGDE